MTVAIVGCGRIGAVHDAAVRACTPDARVVFCDADGERARATAAGRPHYSDLSACLANERPDVVHVCTPPAAHAATAVEALEAGAAVLVEKPMALDRDGASRIAAALRARPGALCVDHNFLFEPCVRAARTWVAEGRLGRLLAADVFYGVDPLPGDAGPGAWAHALPGGRFTDVLPHALYLVREFVGDVARVTACTASASAPTTELGVVLACERGLGSVRVSLASAPWALSLVLRGDRGTATVDLARQRAVLAARPAYGGRHVAQLHLATSTGAQTIAGVAARVAGKLSGRLRGYPGMRALIASFHRAVRDGMPPPVPFADGVAVAAALEDVRAHVEATPGMVA
jgi:predicted dehydrogenase